MTTKKIQLLQKELDLQIKAMYNRFKTDWDAAVAAGTSQADLDLLDEKQDAEDDTIHEIVRVLIVCEKESHAKKLRPNEWFAGFLTSFEDCNCKKISAKQVNIFADRLAEYERTHKHSVYLGEYQGKIYQVTSFGTGGYLKKHDKTEVPNIHAV